MVSRVPAGKGKGLGVGVDVGGGEGGDVPLTVEI
jgi:hypothetical protein